MPSFAERVHQVLADPLAFPAEFRGWLPRWNETTGITLPLSSIIGWTKLYQNSNISSVLPWVIDIDVFMTPISHVNFGSNFLDANAIYNGLRQSSSAQNDEISFDVVLGAGTWTFELMHITSTNRGIYTVSLDVTGTLGTIDGYSGSTTYNNLSSITGFAVAASGKQRLKLKMATKNASSSAYYGSIQHIQLRRTA